MLHGILVTHQRITLELAHAVFGADRSTRGVHAAMNQFEHGILFRQQIGLTPVAATRHVVM